MITSPGGKETLENEASQKYKNEVNLTEDWSVDPTDGLSAHQIDEAICKNGGVFLDFVLQILIPEACFFSAFTWVGF